MMVGEKWYYNKDEPLHFKNKYDIIEKGNFVEILDISEYQSKIKTKRIKVLWNGSIITFSESKILQDFIHERIIKIRKFKKLKQQ